MPGKSLCFTYLIWLFLGWTGLHHFYLGRDRHAFVWWSTLGGYCLIGWIRDSWRIPDYVDDANGEVEYLEKLTYRMKTRSVPKFSLLRFMGELALGYFYGLLVRLALPTEVPRFVSAPLICLAIAIGVHLVGNVGHEQGDLFKPFLAAVLSYCALTIFTGEEASYMYCSLAATCVFQYCREHRQTRGTRRGTCKRGCTLMWGGLILVTLWSSFFFFNASITMPDGETIKLRESAVHFFKSPAWREFTITFWRLYEEAHESGWERTWEQFVNSVDPTGEVNAHNVLNVSREATVGEIRRAYKLLAVKWHPDRHAEEGKAEAEQRFIEIQHAYDVLMRRKKGKEDYAGSQSKRNARTEF